MFSAGISKYVHPLQTQTIASSGSQHQQEKERNWRNAFQEAVKRREEKSEGPTVESVFMLPQ